LEARTIPIETTKGDPPRTERKEDPRFKALYLKHSRTMFNVCMRVLNSREEAEDVLQESFITAFQNIGQLKNDEAFGGWLRSIVMNRAIDRVRARKGWHVELDENMPAEEHSEDEHADYDPRTVMQALAQLPEGYRVIVTLFLFEDQSHKAIAGQLGISEGTSKSQYARGRKKLAELIRKLNDAR
jgi:RNA polymerase sigma factor (sigma-70 family)